MASDRPTPAEHAKQWAIDNAPAMAERVTRLCGKVIEQSMVGILEHCAELIEELKALEKARAADRAALAEELMPLIEAYGAARQRLTRATYMERRGSPISQSVADVNAARAAIVAKLGDAK
ncbi:hypothetical protein [Caldimonas sp. KR1-144]|uniref:hypothetical protein n=1 Tax=Caldimonas sp. KR1-144 TaxID=3400911 RepID=UPI003BFCC5E3